MTYAIPVFALDIRGTGSLVQSGVRGNVGDLLERGRGRKGAWNFDIAEMAAAAVHTHHCPAVPDLTRRGLIVEPEWRRAAAQLVHSDRASGLRRNVARVLSVVHDDVHLP